MIIEYGHIYLSDLISESVDLDPIKRSIDAAKERFTPGDRLWVLVDDKAFSLTEKEKEDISSQVALLLEGLGLRPHEIHFEKRFSEQAESFISRLPSESMKYETIRKAGRKVLFYTKNNRKIPLLTTGSQGLGYSCPTLSSLWRLFKESHGSSLAILDAKYLAVEENVELLINDTGYGNGSKTDYVWI